MILDHDLDHDLDLDHHFRLILKKGDFSLKLGSMQWKFHSINVTQQQLSSLLLGFFLDIRCVGGGNLSPNQVTATTSLIINRLMRKLFVRQITVTSGANWRVYTLHYNLQNAKCIIVLSQPYNKKYGDHCSFRHIKSSTI